MKWTPPKTFEEVQIAMEQLYKLVKNGESTSIPKTETIIKPGYKQVVVDTFGDLVDENDETVNIPEDTNIFKTLSQYAVPSSYYIDLRGYYVTLTTRRFTAELLTLHDNSIPWKTMAVTNVDITNNVSTAGPIINGRDQAGAFTNDSHVNFYAYWDAKANKVSSLSSASATTPTLPNGSTFFIRTGSSYYTTNMLWAKSQIMDKIWQPYEVMADGSVGTGNEDTWVEISTGNVARAIPPTAKSAFGIYGTSTNTVAITVGMGIATNSSGDNYFQNTLKPGTVVYSPSNATYYDIPIESQKIYWMVSNDGAWFYVRNLGFVDDL